MKLASVIILSILVSCTAGAPLKSVDYNNLLNDQNSKVWIINKQMVNGVNIAHGLYRDKDLMIFHDSGTVDVIPMKALGTSYGKKGSYYLNSEKKTMEIVFEDESWVMELAYITEDSVFMKQTKDSDVNFDLQILPIPELNKTH